MTHEETCLRTRQALASALKEKMRKKPLKKITVSELISDCNINRKTFYYHFVDIYDLLKWILDQEAIEIVKGFDLLHDFESLVSFAIDYITSNAYMLSCAYDSMGREEMRRFLAKDFMDITGRLIDQIEQEYSISADPDFKKFLCAFYTEALAGMIIDWFKDQDIRSRETTISYLSLIAHTSLPALLQQHPVTPCINQPSS